ncbi:chromosome segregation protein SMC [bacterium]|nr:MAG: chromosome segregation protein SMC [bacterium]
MPRHPDAIGFLNDLAKAEGKSWFTMVCDLAVNSGMSTLDQQTQDTLLALFTERASYLGMQPGTTVPVPAAAVPVAAFLETLSGFSNFKLLDGTLHIAFNKRITVVFGANSSGKSSLCEALKVLASTEMPSRPLENVRGTGVVAPGFFYKFKGDHAAQAWTQAVGYGPRRSIVKYFDAGIALKNVKSAVEPGRVIVLTPFKLHLFEWAKALTSKFREALQQAKQTNSAKLALALEGVRKEFEKFKNRPLASIDEKALSGLPAQIKVGEAFTQQDMLKEKQAAAAELEKATSEEGLRLLKAEHRELEALLSSLGVLLDSAESLWTLQPVTKAKNLAAKLAEQEVLAKTLIPRGGTLEGLLSLLRAASPLCSLEAATDYACPLCKRKLGVPEVELFKRYHDLLAGELEKDITALRADLAKASEFATAVRAVSRKDWDKSSTIPAALLAEVKSGADLIVGSCDAAKDPTTEAQAALASLGTLSANAAQQLEQKAKAIEAAAEGREELLKQLANLRAEIEPLEYAQSIAERLATLTEVRRMANEAAFWDSKLPSFIPLLKKITESAKEAHEELVVADFETRLDAEYRALTEKPMTSFGVMLARKGSDASVTVLPQIGGKEIEAVLSEGEQRVHALALFFAEIETCPQSVLVFDDPISSFDYNYIANYCTRLRDFTQAHPTRQIIVLTHNWEFFVQLQTTLNACGLNGQFSVQVLENCAVVADYSDKTDELKTDISAILAVTGEPTKAQKEEMAGKMRRLIESVVNTHVFAKQRHQYKQKSQPVTEFHEFTKLVPLLPTEATTLRDLYAKLSITEHDDPRNAYVNTDKATFQTRYDSIIAVEAAVVSRK